MDKTEAQELVRDRYGLVTQARELPSYADQNFVVCDEDGRRYVLKIAHAGQPAAELELENAALLHLESKGFATPRVIADGEGRTLSRLGPHGVRLLSWIAGRPLAELDAPAPALFEDLGAHLGALDEALSDFTHPASGRRLRWDLRNALDTAALLDSHTDRARRERVERVFERFATNTRTRLDALPRGVIHNDANDWNVLVDENDPARVAGLVDFGDLVATALACEPAIALTYAMLAKPEPLAAARPLLAGYHRARPLDTDEVALLADLIETRLCVSVTLSAHERARDPDNEYLGVTEPHAWSLLDWFVSRERGAITRSFEEACTVRTT